MTRQKQIQTGRKPQKSRTGGRVLWAVAGLVLGTVLTALVGKTAMPRLMLVTTESTFPYKETVTRIEDAIEREGWSSPGTLNLTKSMNKHGVEFPHRVQVIQLCKPEYAEQVLQSDRYVSSIMPCAISVWEDDDGRVYISKMNTGLMGKMFGGTIAKVMGGPVAADEHRILADVMIR